MATKQTGTIDSKLKNTWQLVGRMYNMEASLHDITIPIAHFLLNIDSRKGSFASDIAPNLGTESTSLSRIILSLEEKKLITRKEDKTDKRRIKLILTKKGQNKKDIAKKMITDFNKIIYAKIGNKKVNDFFETIDKINEVAEERINYLKDK